MRRLIYIPAVHPIGVDATEDFYKSVAGNDSAALSAIEDVINQINTGIDEYWRKVKEYLDREPLDLQRTRVYSEAITAPAEELLPYIRQRAEKGSPHMQIVMDLLERGAKYEIAEDEEAYWEQSRVHKLIPKIMRSIKRVSDGSGNEDILGQRRELIKKLNEMSEGQATKRDGIIASNINQTLQDGETGILILGAAHRVSRFLEDDLQFRPLNEELVELTHGDSGKAETKYSAEGEAVSTSGTELIG